MATGLPEERLLNLIRGKHKKEKPKKEKSQEGAPVLSGIIKNIFIDNRIMSVSILKPLNQILWAVFILVVIWLIISFTQGANEKKLEAVKKTAAADTADKAAQDTAPAQEVKDFSQYSRDIQGKSLFTAPFAVAGPARPVIDLSKQYTLAGIIDGPDPQAIIEDLASHKYYYLKKGELVNGALVEEVGQGKVKLSYEGQEAVLIQ